MDKLNLAQTYHDTSLMYRWEHCRLIGLINKVYFIIILSGFVLGGLIALIEVINKYVVSGCIVCDNNTGIPNWLLFLIVMIIVLIIPIKLLHMVHVNNALRSTNIPTADGKIVKTWLLYHIVLLVLSVMSFGGLANDNHSAKVFNFIYSAIQCIVLMIEIMVVHKFNIESKISADRRNRSLDERSRVVRGYPAKCFSTTPLI